MAIVVDKATVEVRFSVHTPDFDPADWLVNPPGAFTLVDAGVPTRDWKIVGADVVEKTPAEKEADAVVRKKLQLARRLRAAYDEKHREHRVRFDARLTGELDTYPATLLVAVRALRTSIIGATTSVELDAIVVTLPDP